MRAMKSVLIVTRMGYIEGVFTSFRALANSRGATRINIEGEYEPIREAYNRLSPSRRSMFIAQVIYFLTR